ncbi:MAG: hypothetical protein ACRECX_01995 [Methyloceanibacter sp.]|uniref:hypothetical protein n=1 Tax=Methyloceanibacter sp. TaxID=1965321 RepID=UPI003D6CCA10
MFRLALSLLSSLQIGARIKDTVERSMRKAIVIAVAIVVLLFAAGFGLVAAYQALIAVYGFTALGAAGIVAGALAVLGLLILATLPLFDRPRRRREDYVAAPAEGLGMVDQSVGKAMQQVGPLTLLLIAFAAGLLASRRR